MALFRKSKSKKKYIYESPDKGKTITRRVPMGTIKEVLIDPTGEKDPLTNERGRWMTHEDLLDLGKKEFEEEKLRKTYPALQEAWEKYQLLLLLVKNQDYNK